MIQYIDRKSGELVTERPPAEGLIKFLYQNPLGRHTILPIAKKKFISEWYGRKMSNPSSKDKISSFVSDLGIDMSEALKSIDEYATFNDFFYRQLKPEARPIGEGLISPGDGRLLAFRSAEAVNEFYVKGRKFTLASFLNNEKLAAKYHDGLMLILRLAPNDYHRYHFPFDGIPSASTLIKGDYLSVSPLALVHNFTKVFCENKRSYLELNTSKNGDILLAPVGATMVGSIVDTFTPSDFVEKGDEMGYFAFGGSTIVILLQRDKYQLDDDILDNTSKGYETYVKMGEQIGKPS